MKGQPPPPARAYWGVDSFGTPVPTEITDVAELDSDFYQAGFLQMKVAFVTNPSQPQAA